MAVRIRSPARGSRRLVGALLLVAALGLGLAWRYSNSLQIGWSPVSAGATRQMGASQDGTSHGADNSSGGGGGGGSGISRKQPGGAQTFWRAEPQIKYEGIAKPDPGVVTARCHSALGEWCGRYEAQALLPAVPPPRGTHTCLWGGGNATCNFVGVCDALAGWCRCPAGWTGDDCTSRMKRPCSQHQRQHGFEPYNEPTDPSKGGLTLACADQCDEDIAKCYCNATFAHGHVPAELTDPPGTPPKRQGRPMAHDCRRNAGWDGKRTNEFGRASLEELYGEQGWCQGEQPKHTCACYWDGWAGPTCETPHEMFCINQCNGHGECQLGFCKCHKGWFGHDCAYRTENTTWSPGMEDGDRPWLKEHVHTPAAKDPAPGATRKRPLIYVYELPAMYNSILLSYRMHRGGCVHRLFDVNNKTEHLDANLCNIEIGLHEMLLQSEHRTLDPKEADYFYAPIYTRCLVFPILMSGDWPFFHSGPIAHRNHGATNMLIEVQHWMRSHFPYWDRHGGRDHILMMSHDEASCWVPAVWRPAIILSHWGRTDVPHTSQTGFGPDFYSSEIKHPVWQPEGHLQKLGNFPCYNATKDLIIPTMFSPNKFTHSPLTGAPPRKRRILAFFKGRVQQDNPAFSRGTRQFLTNNSLEHDWWGKHRIWVGDTNPPDETLSYGELLASSVFSLALMGDGWSSRFEDGLLHGCIPVIIQDQVDLMWQSLLNLDDFSLRIPQADMARLPDILGAVPPERVAEMQAAGRKVWHRFTWMRGYRPFASMARGLIEQRRGEAFEKEATRSGAAAEAAAKEQAAEAAQLQQPTPELDFDPGQDDALSTLIQWLYSRLDDLGAHAALR